VTILSTKSFNPTTEIDKNSLTFGHTGDEPSLAFCDPDPPNAKKLLFHDLVCHFYRAKTGFMVGDKRAFLKGKTVFGTSLEGIEGIVIVQHGQKECGDGDSLIKTMMTAAKTTTERDTVLMMAMTIPKTEAGDAGAR
jgi:hypothetical protein